MALGGNSLRIAVMPGDGIGMLRHCQRGLRELHARMVRDRGRGALIRM